MTLFLAYAPVVSNVKAFQPKKKNNNKKEGKGKDEPDTLQPKLQQRCVPRFGFLAMFTTSLQTLTS